MQSDRKRDERIGDADTWRRWKKWKQFLLYIVWQKYTVCPQNEFMIKIIIIYLKFGTSVGCLVILINCFMVEKS